jgi:hypothetical protein
VKLSGQFGERICDTEASDSRWRRKHWLGLAQSYAKAPHFDHYRAAFAEAYLQGDDTMLSHINRTVIEFVRRGPLRPQGLQKSGVPG